MHSSPEITVVQDAIPSHLCNIEFQTAVDSAIPAPGYLVFMQPILPTRTFSRWLTASLNGRSGAVCRRHHLSRREIFTTRSSAVRRISCVRGRLWITAGGEDILLEAGGRFDFSSSGKAVIEALDDALFELGAK